MNVMPAVGGPSNQSVSDKTIFILGAGADIPLGMPAMRTLMKELADWIAKGAPGEGVNKAIRKHVPKIQFALGAEAEKQGEMLGETAFRNSGQIKKLKAEIEKQNAEPSDEVKAVLAVLNGMLKMAEANNLEPETVSGLSKLSGRADEDGLASCIISPNGLQMEPVVRDACRAVFTRTLASATEADKETKTLLENAVASVQDVEERLANLMSGFFTGHVPNQKKYFYLAWLLWAFIRVRQTERLQSEEERPRSVYELIQEVGCQNVLTLNYTDFFHDGLGQKAHYFHGALNHYYRFDTRELVTNDAKIAEADTCEKIVTFFEEMETPNWEQVPPKALIPGIIPPLALKPVMGHKHLEQWHDALQKLKDAEAIVIVGYSFAVADGHFNDMLKLLPQECKVVVLDPNANGLAGMVCRSTGTRDDDLSDRRIGNHNCRAAGRLVIVPAKAEDVSKDDLLKLVEKS